VKLGIHFGHFDLSGGTPALAETVANVAQAAEQGDCAILTLMDHWFQMDRVAPAEEPMLEGYTTLGFLAAHTVLERHCDAVGRDPATIQKTILTVDSDPLAEGGEFIRRMGAVRADGSRAGRAGPAR
jgi:hypothetical protein